VALQVIVQMRQGAAGGLTADAGVDHAIAVIPLFEALLQQIDPPSLLIYAVTCT